MTKTGRKKASPGRKTKDLEEEGPAEEPAGNRDTGREISVPGVSVGPNMRRREEKRPMTREERRARPVVYIRASIFVERPNHRKIIIGHQGKNIKEIGIEARREIEEILEAKVFLELRVKVRLRWRDSADVLDLIEGQKQT
ncbi:MAG: KH domain-containing protein [Sphingobacterium sp.]|nr:KH domain-containing protein [Sphingobacterium sp.]